MTSRQTGDSAKIISVMFEEEGYEPIPKLRLDDKSYGNAIQRFCIVCVDVLLINKDRKTVYLAKRTKKPAEGLWFIGGSMQAGETRLQGMTSIFRRETGLELAGDRFHYFLVADYFWKDRVVEPTSMGCHMEGHLYWSELDDKELSFVVKNLDEKEYDLDFGLREMTREDLVQERVHPVILLAYDTIFV